ncbi:uncharacterized protein AMSG_03102 [Thecamonas trahens ATCC 50062]|uniref:Uncharacterized protein n=1 Tax=Thecamonas trahens ATCC 50062 TaxID=461836 RepID=A0A0L0D3B3_THETB|nr:hypothetical protein AMSG_03102 [Thecamonas trahens ATCC 50062]KNC46665.1 hypothetical protein AMSG_03102 [Thecamonas trahens ATCC 50062]|eukprot:XP_013760437.1 hypothetical protein AMSG_03102 [Thecamonas trahens ATCC 50062]
MAADPTQASFGRLENLYSLSKFIAFRRTTLARDDNPLERRPITEADPLPEGWEVRYSDHGKPFFICHSTRSTTYADPRPLPRYIGMRIVSASGLRKMDTFRKGDPYCLVRICSPATAAVDPARLDKRDRLQVFAKTATCKNSQTPEWDETFYFAINSPNDFVEIYMYDWERGRTDLLMGYIAIPAVEVYAHTMALDSQFPIWALRRELGPPPDGGGVFKASVAPQGALSLEFAMVGPSFADDAAAASPADAARAAAAVAAAAARKARPTCVLCLDAPANALNYPCGHAFLCMTCARTFRDDNGEICNNCREPAQLTAIVTELTCSVCFVDYDASELLGLGECGHLMCVNCSIAIVRVALGDVNEQFPLQCPCIDGETRCPSVVAAESVHNLLRLSTRVLPHGEALSRDEYDKFIRFNDIAAIPLAQRTYCINPACGGLLVLDNGCETDPTTRMECLYCDASWCYGCSVDHPDMTCAEWAAAAHGTDDATRDYIESTSKLCPSPGCGMRWVHYRGHRCHHLNPGRGCPGCGWEGCVACLGPWPCRSCSTYCDANCDCPPCPDCVPNVSHCNLCSGDWRCNNAIREPAAAGASA